jgi:hypothetical protein
VKVVREYRAKYEAMGQILEANPGILDIAHRDCDRALSQSEYGRGGYTSEQILRSIVVMFIEEKSYRDTIILVENSEFLRNFIKLGHKEMMDYTFLCKAYTALSEETWKAVNEALSKYAKKKKRSPRTSCAWIRRRMRPTYITRQIHRCCGTVTERRRV